MITRFPVLAVALTLGLAAGVEQANAVPINSPVPSNAYIVYDGLDWAWGGPCPYSGGCFATGTLAYQGTQGWSLPSAADLAIVDALDSAQPGTFANLFLNNPGGDVPANGTDSVSGASFAQGVTTVGSWATPYFNTGASWCDSIDGISGVWAGSQIASSGDEGFSEQLYVRSAVPEHATWAMMLLGIGGLGVALRSRRRSVSLAASA